MSDLLVPVCVRSGSVQKTIDLQLKLSASTFNYRPIVTGVTCNYRPITTISNGNRYCQSSHGTTVWKIYWKDASASAKYNIFQTAH